MEPNRSAGRHKTMALLRRGVSRDSVSSSEFTPSPSVEERGERSRRRCRYAALVAAGALAGMVVGGCLFAWLSSGDSFRSARVDDVADSAVDTSRSGMQGWDTDLGTVTGKKAPDIPDDLPEGCREAWRSDAGGISCGERIAWSIANKHASSQDAARAVAREFPQCAACDVAPTPSPTSMPTRYDGHEGVYQALPGVSKDEGEDVGELRGSVAQCSARCDNLETCYNFRFCAGVCHMKSAVLSPAAPVSPHDSCTTFIRTDNSAIPSSRCGLRAQHPPAPLLATDLNGIAWPDMCFVGRQEEHIFLIGDWGGIEPHSFFNRGDVPKTADNTKSNLHPRGFWPAEDRHSQLLVAEHFNARAKQSNPGFVLNVGDNFYWGGINRKCGNPANKVFPDVRRQFKTVFEDIYKGPGVDGKPWLGVLGNHDYGGFCFSNGWDQQIAYTWEEASGRWVMPAQFWSTKVYYPDQDFTVDILFIDNNYLDAKHPHADPEHNICGAKWNGRQSVQDCKGTGPHSIWDCVSWFNKLWERQLPWLEAHLNASTADWQIVVSHFPPEDWYHGKRWRTIARDYGIDLWVAGHRHTQEVHYPSQMGPTAYVVTGGGGGVTSEGVPTRDGPDYGYMDVTISKTEIKIDAFAFRKAHHWKQTTTVVSPRPRAVPGPASPCEAVIDKETPGGGTCGSRIRELMEQEHMNATAARNQVAEQIPDPCGACATSTADQEVTAYSQHSQPHEMDYYNTSNAHDVSLYTDPGSGDGMGIEHEL